MRTRDLNKIMLTGQVEAEPEMRFTAEGEPRTTFYITCAGSRDTATVECFRLVAWGEPLAERCNDLPQGTKVLVEGRLQHCTADDPAEQARFTFEVRVRECFVIEPSDAAAMMVPASSRPPTPPTRTINPPAAPRSTVPLSPARAPLPAMPARRTGPRSPATPARRSPSTPVSSARPSSGSDE